MRKKAPYIAAAVGVIVVFWLASMPFRRSSLEIIVDGRPAANVVLQNLMFNKVVRTDANGVARRPADWGDSVVAWFDDPKGGVRMLQFPKHGHRKFIRAGRVSQTITTYFELGNFAWCDEGKSIAFTDEETAKIEGGKVSLEQISRIFEEDPARANELLDELFADDGHD